MSWSLTHDAIDIISMATNILTAIGTLGAVIVALYLEHKSNAIVATGKITFSAIYYPDIGTEKLVVVSITNYGRKNFIINGMYGKDQKTKKIFYIRPDYSHFGSKNSAEFISESETANYFFPENVFTKSCIDVLGLDKLPNNDIKNRLRKVRFLAVTNLGKTINIKKDIDFYSSFCETAVSLEVRN